MNITQVVHQLAHVSDLLSDLSGRLRGASDHPAPINLHINLSLNGTGEFYVLVWLSCPDSTAAVTQPLAVKTRELDEPGKLPPR